MEIHGKLRETDDAEYEVPQPPAPGLTELTYVKRKYANLHPATKAVISVLKSQLDNRILSAGPTYFERLPFETYLRG